MKQEMDVKNLKLAQIRYFDEKVNGVEIPEIKPYAFLIKKNNKYINIFNPTIDLPVYERVPYTNMTYSGEEHGTKLKLASGEVKSGMCYVVEHLDIEKLFDSNSLNIDSIKKFVLNSDLFFMDRIDLLKKSRPKSFIEGLNRRKRLLADQQKKELFEKYINEKEKVTKIKK